MYGKICNDNFITGPYWNVEIKGPESWWITKSITISRVVNQSKVNPELPLYHAVIVNQSKYQMVMLPHQKGKQMLLTLVLENLRRNLQ